MWGGKYFNSVLRVSDESKKIVFNVIIVITVRKEEKKNCRYCSMGKKKTKFTEIIFWEI